MPHRIGANYLLREPGKIITSLAARGFFNWLPDRPYLKLVFIIRLNKRLDLDNPQTFNEKLQWLKMHHRKPEYVIQADKVAVRNYIKEKIGAEYLIPMIGVYYKAQDIPWGDMPSRFVLKCSHASSANIICDDIDALNVKKAEKKLSRWMKRNWYWYGREWPYKTMPHRIIAEKYMVDESGTEFKDYKINCFNGEPKFIQVMSGRRNGRYYLNHYDVDWNPINIPRQNHIEASQLIEKPKHLQKMIEISKILSKDIPYVRIDLYHTEEQVYFGEITFFPMSGFVDYANFETDLALGNLIKLPIAT